MTTLICDFQSIVGEKIKGYATLTAGKVRPSYSSPAVVVHEPTKQEVIEGQTTFENVNPGDAVITVEWADQTQSATIRFVVPESEEPIYLADCLSADSLDPEEIDLLRWGIRENLSGAREMLETAKNLGLTEINGTVDAYFTEAAEILRKALEAAQLAEQTLETIDGKVADTEGVVTDVDQAKQQIQDLLDEIAALELELAGTNTDLAGAVDTINTISPQVSAATQAASEATQKAQNAVNELNNVQTANAAEFNTIKQDLDSAAQTAKQATDAVAQTNQQLGIEVQRILGEVDTALNTATEATAQARIANENLETYQYQLGEIQQEQGHILGQQAEIVGSYEFQLAELDRLSTEISTAASELENISGEQSALVTEMNTQVGSLQELTAAQGAAINAAKSQADKGVSDAAAASSALTNYKKVNDPKVAAAQSTADTARAEATSKANDARIAAEGVAKELADKAQADAEVAAAAEALRIAQEEATAAKNAASADATAKADAAQSAAETLAKAEAKAAQEAAELTAALDASEKANKAKTDAEAKAATLATAAKDAAATALTGYKNLNDPKVTKAQSDATKGINAAAAAKSAADQAALDATNKSKAAREAAEDYAREAAEAAQAQAEETAAAEALRVAQLEATAAKNAAATDAQTKADEAERLAKLYAEAQAKTAKEQAEETAAQDAATKAENARLAAEANAKVLSDKAQQAAAAAQTTANTGVSKADAAKARADKGVTDAATALAKANEANNKLPSITADVSAAAKVAADAANALPGIRTEISTAKKQADKGVADAKAVNDKIPAITQAISGLQEVQVGLGNKAQQGIDDAKVAADLVRSRVDVGTSLVGLSPGTTRPAWSAGMDPVPESENPLGLADAYVARAGQVGNHEYTTVSASDKVKYRVSFWLKASEPGSDLVFDARSPVPVPAGGNTLAFAGNEAVEGALDPGDAGRVFWVKNIPTEWTYYEGIKTPAPGLKHFYIGTRYWRHANGSNRTADQYVADLRIEPVIPSQDDVNKLLIDTAQNHTDILKAQGDINTAQGEINENNRVFQAWQKTINDQQKKWNDASTNATAALARFAITQAEWNELSSTATDANTKAIKAHAALFEGQQQWNEVANAAIQTQANFATKQKDWNAVQEKVNTNFQNWQDAATEMLTSTGKFQKLQNQFNSDQKKWNATQTLVNDAQKGINALNTRTDDAQNKILHDHQRVLDLMNLPDNAVASEPGGLNIGTESSPQYVEFPTWLKDSGYQVYANGALPGGYRIASRQTRTVTSNSYGAYAPVNASTDYRFEFYFRAAEAGSGLVIYIQDQDGNFSPALSSVADDDVPATSSSNHLWWTGNMPGGTGPEVGGFYKITGKIRFKPGVTGIRINRIYFNWSSGAVVTTQELAGIRIYPDIPSQAQVDDAQNKALQALNRFAINQSDWNKVSTDATNALKAGQAAQQELNQKREDWEKGANLAIQHLQNFATKQNEWNRIKDQVDLESQKWQDGAALAIANLQTTSTKYKQWTDGATTAIALNRELIGEQGLIQENQRLQMEALQEAVAEQTKLLYEELKTKPEILIVGDGQSYSDSHITVSLEKSGSQVSKVTVHANGTWAGIVHVEADHGKSDGPGRTFMNYTPLLQKVNLGYTPSRDVVLTRNTSVDHIGKVRITYWVYPGEVLTTQKTGSWLTVEPTQWLTLHTFTATDTATFNAELQVGWDAAGAGPEYGIRLTVNGTPVASDGPRKGVGPDFPWQDGYRQMSIKKTVVVQKGQTVKWEAYVSSGSSNERRIRNFSARATYMYRGLT